MSDQILKPGVCRVCGCTEDSPCLLDEGEQGSVPCWWVDRAHTLCSNTSCLAVVPLGTLEQMECA